MRYLIVIPITLVVGCGNMWSLDDALPPPCVKQIWYTDLDQDGWGDPDGLSEERCSGDQERSLTASNALDCDDADAQITGRVGLSCPHELAALGGGDAMVSGLVYGGSEFIVIYGTSEPIFYAEAQNRCEVEWGGRERIAGGQTDETDDDVWVNTGGLASPDEDQWGQIQGVSEASLDSSNLVWSVFAGFVGLGWEGDFIEGVWDDAAGEFSTEPAWSGAWDWVDGAGFPISTMGFCGGIEPDPSDFFPTLNPAEPKAGVNFDREVDRIRLSVVKGDSADWCLGLPLDALPFDAAADTGLYETDDDAPAYEETSGHYLCERSVPDPAEFFGMEIASTVD